MALFQRKLKRFLALPGQEQCWCVLTLALLALSRLLVRLTTARIYTRLCGQDVGLAPFCTLSTPAHQAQAHRIGRIIHAVAAITPWRSLCLEQALCAQFFVRWYGIPAVTFFGMARSAGEGLQAHAWVCTGPRAITGGQSFGRYTVVRAFSHSALIQGR